VRLWSLHPQLLDRAALVAGWREGLLAQAVLLERTKGYRNHPQLDRFRAHPQPPQAVAAWLLALADEADARGYRFDRSRVFSEPILAPALEVTTGQLDFELEHLRAKVVVRQPDWRAKLPERDARPHPLFTSVPGGVEAWERAH